MIYIQKTTEPKKWTEQRLTPGITFDGMDKTVMREHLLKEQGYICAYCMRRIRDDNMKIEHYVARTPVNELDYHNLLAVCDGNQNLQSAEGKVDRKRFTCDTMKGNKAIHISPLRKADMQKIYYDNQGKIYYRDTQYQNELDDILNLNDSFGYLIKGREAVLKPIIDKLQRLKPGQGAATELRKMKRFYDNMDSNGAYVSYVGIIRWYVNRHLRKYS